MYPDYTWTRCLCILLSLGATVYTLVLATSAPFLRVGGFFVGKIVSSCQIVAILATYASVLCDPPRSLSLRILAEKDSFPLSKIFVCLDTGLGFPCSGLSALLSASCGYAMLD